MNEFTQIFPPFLKAKLLFWLPVYFSDKEILTKLVLLLRERIYYGRVVPGSVSISAHDKKGKRDNLGIISHISPKKHIL